MFTVMGQLGLGLLPAMLAVALWCRSVTSSNGSVTAACTALHIDYATLPPDAVLLIGVDAIKSIWGARPLPVSDPIGSSISFVGLDLPLTGDHHRHLPARFLSPFAVLQTIIGKIAVAGLQDREAVRSLGINIGKYFAIHLCPGERRRPGGVLYTPIAACTLHGLSCADPLTFAVVIVGGMGNLGDRRGRLRPGAWSWPLPAAFGDRPPKPWSYVVMALVSDFPPDRGSSEQTTKVKTNDQELMIDLLGL